MPVDQISSLYTKGRPICCDKVLGLEDHSTIDDKRGLITNIIEEDQIYHLKQQIWYRGTKDADGWFTLRNLATGNFLTAEWSKVEPFTMIIQTDPSTIEIQDENESSKPIYFTSDAEAVITVGIRSNTKQENVIVEDDFIMTQVVKERMALLCGATNFSLALRNSEHAAR